MEGKKSPLGSSSSSSSSSFASDLFGSKDSPVPKPSGLFDTIFALPSSKGLGRGHIRSEMVEQKEGKVTTGKPGRDSDIISEGKIHVPLNEEKGPPCHYSSSIYYGGQDIFSNPTNNQTSSSSSSSASSSSSSVYSTFRDKEGEDDSGTASRGNWWQGSLYY